MIPSLSLFQLDIARMRNAVTRYRNDPKQLRRPLLITAGIIFYLYWNIFRPLTKHKTGVLADWHWVRYAFPVVLAYLAAMIGSWGRMNRWLVRWASGSWSVLPVEPQPISKWLTGTMLLMDSGWLALGIVLSIGLTMVLGLSWLNEFPFLLLAAALLIAAAAVAKMFAVLILRLTGRRILQWPNWLLRMIGSMLAMMLVQPLVGFWLLAEYQQQHEAMGFALAILLILAAVVAGLAFLARMLLVREWPEIAESFELQQTQRREKSDVPLANLLIKPMTSPVSRFVSLYNLRSGNEMRSWGKLVYTGGRRVYMFLIMFFGVAFLDFVVCMAARQEHDTRILIAGGAGWTTMYMLTMIPPIPPIYRLLRMMPVTFIEWLRAVGTLPLALSSVLLIGCSIFASIVDPDTAYQTLAGMWGAFLGASVLRLLVMSAYPDGGQANEFIFLAVVGVCVLAYFTLTWIAVVPVALGAMIYFYRKAAREWRGREEGLSV